MRKTKQLLTEKYRPDKFADCVGNKEIFEQLKNLVENQNLPHLAFFGGAGIGKTTGAWVVCKELYGKNYDNYVKELNASDKRGIDVIRGEVKTHTKTKGFGVEDHLHKEVILDEADELTDDAQTALRRTMEVHSANCRFILTGNYKQNLIDPLLDRCRVFEFQQPKPEEIYERIKYIAEQENINITDEALHLISQKCNGSIRNAINHLEIALVSKKQVTVDDIIGMKVKTSGDVSKIINLCFKGEFVKARNMIYGLLKKGIVFKNFLKDVHNTVLFSEKISAKLKCLVLEACMICERDRNDGCDEDIIISGLMAMAFKAKVFSKPIVSINNLGDK